MTKFMALYKSSVSAQEQMANSSPEEMKAGMDAWMAWAAKAGDALVDLGSPMSSVAHLGPGSSDGEISGFSILQGETVDAVTEVLAGHPHLDWGGAIDVVEYLAMPGMG
jgi:hypothetical protein